MYLLVFKEADMRVGAINNTNFGMALKATPEAKKIIYNNITGNGIQKLAELKKMSEKDIVDVNIRVESFPIRLNASEVTYDQLVIDVADGVEHSYRPEPNSWLIVNAVKRAVKQAHKMSKKQEAINNLGL